MTLLLPFLSLVACDDGSADTGEVQDTGAGDTDMDTDTDTGETDDTNGGTGYQVTDAESAAAALVGATLPGSLAIITFFQSPDAAGCPNVVDDGAGTITITGNNCTSESGLTYDGTVVLVEGEGTYTITFSDWQITSADLNLGANGEISISEDLVFSGSALTANYQNAEYGLANRHDYTYANWSQQGSGMLFLPTNFIGESTIDGEPVQFSGSWEFADSCTGHPTAGSLVASGTTRSAVLRMLANHRSRSELMSPAM